MFSAASALRNKEARIAGYVWALSLPYLSDFTEEISDAAMLQWMADTDTPPNGDIAYYWELGALDSKWLIRQDEYLSPADIMERMGFNADLVRTAIKSGVLQTEIIAGEYAIWAPHARDWYRSLHDTQEEQ